MTELLYLEDSYIKEFSATITSIDELNHALELDKTAFYPGGGGQPADNGTLVINTNEYLVKRSKKIEGKILHFIEGDYLSLQKESSVQGKINWERRYQLMRTHTAMHILCGVVFRDYGASVTGGNMEPLKGRMDFEFETMSKELVDKIEKAVNIEVANSRSIKTAILPRKEAFQIPDLIRTKINLLPPNIKQVRIVEIVGLDLQADGGTHVHNTSEVGIIHITGYKSKGKINKRIYIELDN